MKRDSHIQFNNAQQIKEYQSIRLQEDIEYIYNNSPFYKRLFDNNGIEVSSIKNIEDLQKIPVTTKDMLQQHNEDFIAVDKSKIIDYITTSGTSGEPVNFVLSDEDLDRLAYNESLSFTTAGCSKDDTIQLMTTIDKRFMAGLAYFLGARDLGCGIVRVGNGVPELQWDTINRIHPNTCIVVPSFLIRIADYAKKAGIDQSKCSIKKAICIGEPLRESNGEYNALGKKIVSAWPDIELFSTYASTEMQSSFTECVHHCGCHTPVDLIIVELLDKNDQPVKDGEIGEVTITTLGVKAMPLIRFKTGDMCIGNSTPCKCGRNSLRLSSVIGRKGQMIKFKGTTLYPSALYDVLDNISDVENYIVEVYTGELGTDQLVVKIGSKRTDSAFEKEIKDIFRSKIRVAPEILFEPIDYITQKQFPATKRKQLKFMDLR